MTDDLADALALRRVVVPTRLGPVVVRTGRETGGPATLLLHGAAGTWTTWAPLLATADAAGTPLTDVVVPDLPGWGQSGGTATDVAQLSCALVELMRALGHRRWRVVGHSLGGFVALDLAARFRVETLAVGAVSPSGVGVLDAVARPVLGGLRLPGFAGMLLAMRMLRGLGDAAPPLLRALRRTGLLRRLARPLFARPAEVDAAVTDALADEIRPAAFLAAAAASRDYDRTLWRRIACPVRLVRGTRDVFARADDTARLAAAVRDLDETRLADAGHFANVERPDAVLRALAEVWTASPSGRSVAEPGRLSPA